MSPKSIFRVSILGAALSTVLIACASQPKPQGASVDSMRQATVLVENESSHGTGIILGENWILTAEHVISEEQPEIVFFGGEKVQGRVHWKDAALDLAIVEVSVPGKYDAAQVDCGAVGKGDLVVAVGHPITTRWVAVEGFVEETSIVESTHLMALGFPLSVGNSGGPVFDKRGDIVGVVSAILVDQREYERVTAASNGTYMPQSGIGAMIPASHFCDTIKAVEPRHGGTGIKIAQYSE